MPTEADARRLLRDYGLAPGDLRMRRLRGGADNLNLRLTAAGFDLVLRRYDVTPPDEVRWELGLVHHLRDRGFPTPEVLRRVDGQYSGPFDGGVAALFRHVPGTRPPRRALWAGARVAAAVADLHTLTAGLPRSATRTRTDVRRLQAFQNAARASADRDVAWLLAEVERGLRWHHDHGSEFAELLRGVIHHDAHAGNALFVPCRQLVALLDFDEAYEDLFIVDAARLVRLWAPSAPGSGVTEKRVRRIVAGYESRRPLTPAERRWLPDFILWTSLADVAEYASGHLRDGDRTGGLAGSYSYATYRELLRDPSWRRALE